MNSLPPTLLLTLCLLAATVLGAGIGACLWHLRSAARLERSLEAARHASVSERAALGAMLARERESAALARTEAREVAARTRAESERLQLRHDTLAAHSREQARRIDALEAEILAYEERAARLGRAPAAAGDRAERRPATRQPSGPRSGGPTIHRDAGRSVAARTDDDDLPVLNRRVGSRPAPGAGFPIGGDLDIPTLAESELPREADELALELLDTRDLFPDRDD